MKREELTLDGIKQFWVRCENTQQKFAVLDDIFSLLTVGQTIIFVEVGMIVPTPVSISDSCLGHHVSSFLSLLRSHFSMTQHSLNDITTVKHTSNLPHTSRSPSPSPSPSARTTPATWSASCEASSTRCPV